MNIGSQQFLNDHISQITKLLSVFDFYFWQIYLSILIQFYLFMAMSLISLMKVSL